MRAGSDPLLLETLLQALTQANDTTLRNLWIDWTVSMLPWLRPFLRVLVRSCAQRANTQVVACSLMQCSG